MNNENENNNIESKGIENKEIQGKEIQKTEDIGFGPNLDNEHADTNNLATNNAENNVVNQHIEHTGNIGIENNQNPLVENELNEHVYIEENLNPWLSIWTKPRKTIRYIINNDPSKHVVLLAMIYGIINGLDNACEKSLGDNFSFYTILLIAILLGSIGGIIYIYLSAALLKWTGNWIGGKGTTENIRAAIVWGLNPYIVVSILWIPELVLFGDEMFTTATSRIDYSLSLTIVYFTFVIIETIGGIWSFIVSLKCLGEVQGFSAWKALGNYILCGLVLFVPILIIVFFSFLV